MIKILFRIISFCAIFTAVGHLVGSFQEIPIEQKEVLETTKQMEQTKIPFPIGSPKSYSEVFLGNNLITSLALFLIGIQFFLYSNKIQLDKFDLKIIFFISFSLVLISIISILFFFPLPAFFTGLGGVVGIYIILKRKDSNYKNFL